MPNWSCCQEEYFLAWSVATGVLELVWWDGKWGIISIDKWWHDKFWAVLCDNELSERLLAAFALDKGSTGRLCLILLTCFWCLCYILYLVFTVCCTLCYLYLMSCWPRFLSAFVWSCDWQSKARSEIPLQSISLFLLLLQFMVHPKTQ
jgi:hypothetical protein